MVDSDEGDDGLGEALAALRAVADDGVDFDGLAVGRDDGGLRFAVPGAEYRGLDAEAFDARACEHAAYVREWYVWHQEMPQDPAQWDFLRWVERAGEYQGPERRQRLAADGVTREWGQLSVQVRLVDPEGSRGEDGGGNSRDADDNGSDADRRGRDAAGSGRDTDGDGHRRRYTLRHVDDADTPVEDLEQYTDPYDARRLRKEDDRGRYRPLSTAPTLRSGWAFVGLEPAAVVRAVEGFYPATVANWHREREGKLDVTHWEAAVARHTGIYGVVQTWNRGEGHEHVDWVAEACCVDSQCLKRREWEYDADTPLSVDGGDGIFPCREPCSLVVAAARRWTRLEAEESRTYEFELTPSEKEQVETVVDAVADGRVEEVREADFADGANRYRARFLRAKRFEDGTLCGVPTDRDEEDEGGADTGDSTGDDAGTNGESGAEEGESGAESDAERNDG
ncbi:MAG: DR2241 family protein [Haloarculaceae archaeon]